MSIVINNYYTDNETVFKQLDLLLTQNKTIMSDLNAIKDKLAAQTGALDGISTNVTGIQTDLAALKAKIAELRANENAAVQAALDELEPLVNGVSTKIDVIGATTASLDAETDPGAV